MGLLLLSCCCCSSFFARVVRAVITNGTLVSVRIDWAPRSQWFTDRLHAATFLCGRSNHSAEFGPNGREITPKLEVHATADLFPKAVEMHRAQGPRSLASAVLQDCRSSSAADIGSPSSRPLAQRQLPRWCRSECRSSISESDVTDRIGEHARLVAWKNVTAVGHMPNG